MEELNYWQNNEHDCCNYVHPQSAPTCVCGSFKEYIAKHIESNCNGLYDDGQYDQIAGILGLSLVIVFY